MTYYHTTKISSFLSIFNGKDLQGIILRAYSPFGTSDNQDTRYFLTQLGKTTHKTQFGAIKKLITAPKTSQCPWQKSQQRNIDYPFIVCFTEGDDNPVIWDNYGEHGRGVAIGIDIDSLDDIKVLNDPHKSCKHLKKYTCHYWTKEDIKKRFVNEYQNYFKHSRLKEEQQRDLLTVAALIKNPSYSKENETRIVVWAPNTMRVNIDYGRCSKPREYIELCIPISLVDSIVIGPNTSEEDAEKIKRIAEQYGIKNVQVSKVKTPKNQHTYRLTALDPRASGGDDNAFYFGRDVSSFEDSAVMERSEYKKIFGKDRNRVSSFKKRFSVLKITNEDKDGKHTIYRLFRPSNKKELEGKVAVTYHSLLFLKEDDYDLLKNDTSVTVEPSSALMFLLHHPDGITHSGFLLAAIALIISTLSAIISIIC